MLQVDEWAEFQAPPNVGVLIKVLRQELDAVLAAKITNPGLDVHSNKCVSVIMSLLATDGF
jgi:ATP-dependent RNA helicase DHX57